VNAVCLALAHAGLENKFKRFFDFSIDVFCGDRLGFE
jgi:hypothetical protein